MNHICSGKDAMLARIRAAYALLNLETARLAYPRKRKKSELWLEKKTNIYMAYELDAQQKAHTHAIAHKTKHKTSTKRSTTSKHTHTQLVANSEKTLSLFVVF